MVKISAAVEDLCRVSGEVAATLVNVRYRRPGTVHIFHNGLHGVLIVNGEESEFRITAKDRDGKKIKGKLIDAIEAALIDTDTVAIATDSTKILDHLRKVEGSRFEPAYMRQVYIRDGRCYDFLNI